MPDFHPINVSDLFGQQSASSMSRVYNSGQGSSLTSLGDQTFFYFMTVRVSVPNRQAQIFYETSTGLGPDEEIIFTLRSMRNATLRDDIIFVAQSSDVPAAGVYKSPVLEFDYIPVTVVALQITRTPGSAPLTPDVWLCMQPF